MIKIRIDVDYPFASRVKSCLYVGLRIKRRGGAGYLYNARLLARMINESEKDVKGYWFFTPYTIPDNRLLELLTPERHEIGLHVATKPVQEWKTLEKETGRIIRIYTIHGTQNKLARLLWGRKFSQAQAAIPKDFLLDSFHNQRTLSLDMERYRLGFSAMLSEAEKWIQQDIVLSVHPEWLLRKNMRSKRGPYDDVVRALLDVDGDLNGLSVKKKGFFNLGHDTYEYEKNIQPDDVFCEKLRERGVDVYTFLDRRWSSPIENPPENWVLEDDNVGLLEIKTYDEWMHRVGKKTRNMIRKAEKASVKISVVEPNDKLAEGIWKIYNETPIRQERAFTHYGEPLDVVRGNMYAAKNNTFIGAYLGDELVGFIQILYGDGVAIVSNILSLQHHWDKALNNAVLAKAVEVCAEKGQRWLMYGRFGNHPSLDRFKDNNGFVKYPIKRVYIPLTNKGRLAIKLGMHKAPKDALPEFLKGLMIPTTNWVSRTKVKVKMHLHRRAKAAISPRKPLVPLLF